MSHDAPNQQRPPRTDSARKATLADAERATSMSPAAAAAPAAAPPRNVTSPSPGHYPRYSTGYAHAPPTPNAHSHYHQHHPAHQAGATFSPYPNAAPADGYGYPGQPYQHGRHSVDALQYARPPSRSQSQSSASGSVASPHEGPVTTPLYTPHYSPSFPGVSPTPSVGPSSRTRWAWVPIEVPQGHISDESPLQYAPYPPTFYTPPAAPVTHAPSTPHSPYQQGYGELAAPAAPAYGTAATPSNYTPSYLYPLHPAHYMPSPGHSSHAPGAAPGRAPRSGPQQAGHSFKGVKGDNALGAGNRRQSNQSGRSGSAQRRPSSNSSGNVSSPQPVTAAVPQRQPSSALEAQADLFEPTVGSSLPSDMAGEDLRSVAVARDVGPAAVTPDADLDTSFDAPVDLNGAERVPGSGLRPHYHPQQGPRSEWVLWCGNVPQDATVEELWERFSRLTPDEYRAWLASPEGQEHAADSPVTDDDDVEEHGVLSIFIISRSSCAFVNYASLAHLNRAVKYFHGKQVRPHDPRCPKLVCRVRKKDDEAQAGVAGQRGRGIHVAWLKQQRELERAQEAANAEPLSPPPPKDASSPLVPAGLTSAASYSSSGSASYASTNSSLFRHPAFRQRFFILKSLRSDDLDRSVETGYWATQPHNESVLDQAYRNSEAVYLIFGVNQTGQFHGYARMAGPIFTSTNEIRDKEEQRRRASLSSVVSAASNSLAPTTIAEEDGDEADPPHPSAHSPHGSGLRRAHPTLAKRDIEAARYLFRGLSVDGSGGEGSHSVPTTSPLPITPTMEEAVVGKGAVSPQRQNTITPQSADTSAQANTWPYTYLKNGAEDEASARHRFASAPLGDSPAAQVTAEPDEYGVRRIDMEAEDAHTTSSQSDQPSLGPSDSASWSSADPRVAEQIALRAVIHNLRLDEMESRGQAEMLETQLRSSSNQTDATVTAKASEVGTPHGDTRTPPRQSSSDSWGKPFRVEWIRTDPLPFQKVKKLRNPWRDNRQVKVSRDGTELEPGVGRQLLEEWSRLRPTPPAPVDGTKASGKPSPAAPRSTSGEDE